MRKVLDRILRECKKSEKSLYNLQKEVHAEIAESGFNADEQSTFFTQSQYETSDQNGGEKCVERYGHKVWIDDIWVSSNRIPQSKKAMVKNGRYPVKTVALWYTPYTYNTAITTEPMRLTPQELYKRAEKEKVLYEDRYIKVAMVRRNAIPLFRSVQWSHKMAQHEYVMYLKQSIPTKRQAQILKEINNAMKVCSEKYRDGEISKEWYNKTQKELLTDRIKWEKKTQKWMEIFHADKLTTLFQKANYIINDWYED